MNNLDDMYEFADQNNVIVASFHLDKVGSLSHMTEAGNCYIAIDYMQIESTADEKNKLAHELGHCMTGAFYNRYSKFDIRQKYEVRADRWEINQLLPFEDLNNAICSGVYTLWELTEYFVFPEQLIHKAIEYYTKTRGLCFGDPKSQLMMY